MKIAEKTQKQLEDYHVNSEIAYSSNEIDQRGSCDLNFQNSNLNQGQNRRRQLSLRQQVCLIISICVLTVLILFVISVGVNNFLLKEKQFYRLDGIPNQKARIDYKSKQAATDKLNLPEQQLLKLQINKLEERIKSLENQVRVDHYEITTVKGRLFDLSKEQRFKSNQNKAENKTSGNQKQLDLNETKSTDTKQEHSSNNHTSQAKFKVRQKFRSHTPQISNTKDLYEFSISINEVVSKSSMNNIYRNEESTWSGIRKSQYERAIRLLEVVHNVNFKGEFVFDHFNFYTSAEEKYKTLFKILYEEKKYYWEKYEISKYIHDQIGMCLVVPSFNNVETRIYLRNLDSIFQQEYQNYHLVYINDVSTDGTGDYVKAYMEQNGIPPEKYTIINNQKNLGGTANTYIGVHEHCKDGEIVILLDGDDALIGRQVFSLLNAVYQKEKVSMTYGQFLLIQKNNVMSGFSRMIPENSLKAGTFRQLKSFFTSHLKTMYVDLFKKIKKQDLQYQNGTFYDFAYDVAYMTPAIQMSGTRIKFLTELNYEYRFDTGLNQGHAGQMRVESEVYQKPAYSKLQTMPFADNPKTIHYP